MRDLHRNKRGLWYSLPGESVPILDEYGNDTLETEIVFSDPTELKANVSANIGEEAVSVFGAQTEYSRTISMSGECPLVEGARVWFGKVPNATADDNNYTVTRVADSKNGFLVALREVSAHA